MPRASSSGGLSRIQYQVLLALAGAPRHGYAIAERVAAESDGALTPRAGSLYRVIARLSAEGWLEETDETGDRGRHPGLARRYYALTDAGRRALATEAERLKRVATMAEERLGIVRSQS